ncbi:MAG: hypothetical protein AB7S78_10000 [Candidatus Omnitrophota bacterium]
MDNCNFCNKETTRWEEIKSRDIVEVECPMCGLYRISQEALEDTNFQRIPQDHLHLFSGYIRNISSDRNLLSITSQMCGQISDIVSRFTKISVPDKTNHILKFIYANAPKVLTKVELTDNDVYRFYLSAPGDLKTILEYLQERKWIELNTDSGPVGTLTKYKCRTTVTGWQKYEGLKEINVSSKKVFIACQFGTDYQEELVRTIKEACNECGFEANLVSDQRHNDDISHKIISDIKESRFIIADFTDQNNGAYFEAGYAMGMGLDVVKLCRKDHMDDVDTNTGKRKRLHFDTRQYAHIVWENDKWDALKENLINQIKATIK